MAQHIFISYDHDDRAYARTLAEHLRQQGLEVWMDDRIDYGDRWWRTVDRAIRTCAACVVVMTPAAEESPWVERELLLAQREKKPIYPLLLRGRGLSLLIALQHVDVTGGRMPPPRLIARLKRAQAVPPPQQGALVASRRGGRYHRSGCPFAARIRPENGLTFPTPAAALAKGYTPCRHCKPPL